MNICATSGLISVIPVLISWRQINPTVCDHSTRRG
jgi:hypothetical protein